MAREKDEVLVFAGKKLQDALKPFGRWTIAITKHSDKVKGPEVFPRRWVVVRTITWLSRAADLQAADVHPWRWCSDIRLLRRYSR